MVVNKVPIERSRDMFIARLFSNIHDPHDANNAILHVFPRDSFRRLAASHC